MEKEIKHETLRKEIKEMVSADQAMRVAAEKGFGEWNDKIDIENTKRMKEVVENIGWPMISVFGEETSHDAWLLVQHADRDVAFQRSCLELMKKLPEGEVRKADIAYLTDRILRNENRPQVYGTQFVMNELDGRYVPAQTENPETVEERRKEMGLDTLEENTKRINDRFNLN